MDFQINHLNHHINSEGSQPKKSVGIKVRCKIFSQASGVLFNPNKVGARKKKLFHLTI